MPMPSFQGFSRLFVVLSLVSAAAFADPVVDYSGSLCRDGGRDSTLQSTANASCVCIDRALDLLANHRAAVEKEYANGINFKVFFASPDFYLTRLRNRQAQCDGGSIKFHCVGMCNQADGELAYVRVILGWVWPTVNVCDEFFQLGASQQVDTITHEMGRLENIGDSPNFDTDNIYVWDDIVGHLCDEATYQRLSKE
jgi:hypothetical protein